MTADLGTPGQNTISRAELGAYFRRLGVDHGGRAAAEVFDDIIRHRPPADPETPLSDAEHAIGQVIRLAESWQMAGGQLDAAYATGALLAICTPWTGMPLRELEAIGTGPLLDPDCRDGKCSSCAGAPCEHECHKKAEAGHG